jgi:hypothetical protein
MLLRFPSEVNGADCMSEVFRIAIVAAHSDDWKTTKKFLTSDIGDSAVSAFETQVRMVGP